MFRRRLLIIMFILAPMIMRAQYDVSFAHYSDMQPSFNPAAAGKDPKLNVTVAYAMDLAGFKHNPQTMYAAADLPFYFLKTYHGGGIQFINDKLGLFSHQRLELQYALQTRLFGGTLSTGIQAGVLSESFDGSKVDVEDPGDPAIPTTSLDGNQIDLSAGLYYKHGRWYVGVSGLHLNSPCVELGETNELNIDPTFYLTGGYNIRLRNPFLSIQSSFLVRSDLVAYRGDVGGRLVYTHEGKMMYGGLSWSPTNSVTFLIGGTFQGIVAGYSYEVYTSAINPENGSHELFLGYQVDLNLIKKGKNKHKSVRIL